MSVNKPNSGGGTDDTTHHLILIKEPPASLVALRQELAFHPDICAEAVKGNSFQEVIGISCLQLDIAVDGIYDVEPICAMLVEVLRKKRFHSSSSSHPHLSHKDLVDVELVEKEGTVELVKRDRNVTTILPEDAVVTEKYTSQPCKDGSNNGSGTTGATGIYSSDGESS